MAAALEEKYRSAAELLPDDAVSVYRDIALGQHGSDPDSIKIREQAIQKLADLYAAKGNAAALRSLLTELRPLFALIPKAKTAKIVRTIIETISKVPDSTELQVCPPPAKSGPRCLFVAGKDLRANVEQCLVQLEICKEQVEWARSEKRTFLRQRIEARLANLYLETKDFTAALALISRLLTEVICGSTELMWKQDRTRRLFLGEV